MCNPFFHLELECAMVEPHRTLQTGLMKIVVTLKSLQSPACNICVCPIKDRISKWGIDKNVHTCTHQVRGWDGVRV